MNECLSKFHLYSFISFSELFSVSPSWVLISAINSYNKTLMEATTLSKICFFMNLYAVLRSLNSKYFGSHVNIVLFGIVYKTKICKHKGPKLIYLCRHIYRKITFTCASSLYICIHIHYIYITFTVTYTMYLYVYM